ncbi:sugar phosphate nucleotidyltransferase [Bacillus testis]|uniref:sugar phosphate nucleotidyltransferase n=1 Tax=Bacillus testis TaxID=1622072 RepID=UPI00067F17CD|nr:sugar phosphate nucleotidyltransferase [Bacillus testis]
MRLVLLSGGSGKRLWPLSNDSRSKQFLKVLSNQENELESMVQRVWGQLERLGVAENAVIATSKSQIDMIKSQIGEHVKIIVEPERRDTFPAIALAASFLLSEEGVDEEEIVAVLPVDPYVDDAFFKRVLDLEEVLKTTDADLALLGINPTYPSSKYGYIVPSSVSNSVITVSYFKEKPTETEAESLIEEGAIWNSGVFAFKLGSMINVIKKRNLPVVYSELLKQYSSLPKISFDYEVVEKTEKIAAIGYEGYWKDLGTWNTLTEEMGSDSIGHVYRWGDCRDTHIINELHIPVTVMDIQNAVVTVSSDGILVSDKMASQKIKEVVEGLNQPPMYKEHRWGYSRVLDYAKYDDGTQNVTKRIFVKASKHISYHSHKNHEKVWTIVNGEGNFVLNGNIRVVKKGDILTIPDGKNHVLNAITDLELIEIQTGFPIVEGDVERKYFDWSDIEADCYQINYK